MKNGRDKFHFALAAVSFCLAPAAAMAYIDPGNGAYMVQALFTIVGAALFYLRHPIRTLKATWYRLTSRHESVAAIDSSADAQPGVEVLSDAGSDTGSAQGRL